MEDIPDIIEKFPKDGVIRKKKKVSNPFYFSLIFNGNKERGNMFGNIKEGNILIGDSEMQYVVFGKGDRSLVIIPGLSDGIRTVKGTKLILWQQFRKFAIGYKVWVFSRKNKLKPQMTTREMAEEQALAMDKLGINKACIMGISQGGMIAQWMAIDYSQKVDKMILVVTISRANNTIQSVIGHWIYLAEKEEYDKLAIDNLEKNYSEKNIKKIRPFFLFAKKSIKPVSKERFIIQAISCLTHNAYRELKGIKCPTLVIGGGADKIIGGVESQQEMADAISGSKIIIYPELGHDAYTKKDFHQIVLDFLR